MIIYDGTGAKILDVTVDDNSYRHRVIMGDHNLTLHYSLAEHVEIPVGSYCDFQGERYTLERPESLKMQHSRNFEYTVVMESSQAKARIWKFRNPVDGRLKFSLTAKPKEHLQMFIDNMNRRDSGWKIGKCVDGPEILINYNHAYCIDALGQMASECKTEYEFAGKTVSLCKVEYNKNNPLPLSYGRGNGFKPGVGRSNYGDTPPVEILFVQGGTQNIDASKYGSTELLLPKNQTIRYDGVYFEDEEGFNADNARTYITDDLGLSIRRGDKALTSLAEDSLDCSEVYPKRVGEISGVVVVDEAKNFYDIIDDGIPEALDYADCLIEGETMTVIFQSGMLAGREFEVKYYHAASNGKAARRFEIVPAELDGQTMPNKTFAPKAGDTYAVFNCRMPDAYVCDDATKSGASWDMFRTGVKHLFDNEEQRFSFTGELDGIWSKKDWVNIGGRIILGGYIRFTNESFQREGVLVRITGIKDYINNPYSPVIELSNSTVGTSVASTLQQLESEEVLVEKLHGEALQFTKRRFRDAKETMAMLEDALLDNFTNSINPIAVQTMQMLVGDESLQFRFVNSKTDPVAVAHNVTYDGTAKQLKAPAGIIQHLTLGISTLSSEHKPSEYKYWDMAEYTSARLDDGTKKYYLYAKVSKTAQTGVFLLSETAIALEGVSGYYHLLVGVLNSEYDGERSFVTLYGFSEILPGRITTDKVVSGDGSSYFDMLNNAMKLGDALDFNSQGDHKLRLKGTLVQSQSGDEDYMGVYRGTYNDSYTYYQGDEVVFTVNGVTSTYRYINGTPGKGTDPSHSTHWQVMAQGVKGDKGDQGIQGVPGEDGIPGKDGKTLYTWIRYADDANGGGISNDPTGKDFIGFAYNKETATESNNPEDYAWSDIKGEQGVPGATGADGRTLYTWIAYSDNASGSPMYQQPKETTQYIGIATNKETATESTDPNDYTWSKFKGDKGDQGIQGVPGEDGKTSYFHIKYSSVPNPTSADQMTETPSDYVGTYVDYTEADSNEPSKYKWARFKGFDGSDGLPGINGEDGRTSYLHIKYSDDGGSTFTRGVGMRLLATGAFSFVGNGVKFLNESGRTATGWNGEAPGKWIGMYHDFTKEDSLDPAMYTWSRIKGEDGAQGDKGDTGNFTELRFAKNGSTTTPPELVVSDIDPSGWSTVTPNVGTLEYLWMTSAIKNGNGIELVSQWTTPVRVSPYDGKDGQDGQDGEDGKSPAMTYQGVYGSSKTYYGNQYRLDCVKYGSAYYIARIDAGTFSGVVPTDTSKWNPFGASFESVATQLLLAENANIAGWIFRNNRLESQDGTIWLDGVKGQIMAKGGFSGTLTAENMFMPFEGVTSSRTLQTTDPTNITLKGAMYEPILTLPNDVSFNGMFLNIYLPPRISKMDAPGIIAGKILCPNKGTVHDLYVDQYYASRIYSMYGGIVQLLCIGAQWILLNGSNLLEYVEYQ